MNYRLGFIGSWYNQDTGDTNFGILDQRLAMKWVQEGFFDQSFQMASAKKLN